MGNAIITPDEAIRLLQEGNIRYATHRPLYPNLNKDRRTITAAQGQKPFVTVLSCSDSRVPVEQILDRGIGDVFVVRVAGNVVGETGLASVEYAVDCLEAPLFVVMGHTNCGAVTAVVNASLNGGGLGKVAEKISAAVERTKKAGLGASDDGFLVEAIKANIWKAIEDTLSASSCIRQKTNTGELKIVGALYDIETGKIEWMGPHPDQASLLQ